MKLLVCCLLLLTIHGMNCDDWDDDSDENFGETKYGVGFEFGGTAKSKMEVGTKNGESLFLNKMIKGKAYGGAGIVETHKPYEPKVPIA